METNFFPILAFEGSRQLGIEPPNQLKPKHFSDPNIEYISVMAFLTKLFQISRKKDLLRIIGINLNNVFVDKEVCEVFFYLYFLLNIILIIR